MPVADDHPFPLLEACSPHYSIRCYHTAELPSLAPSWGGRGPSQSQVAKALMRRQQARVDWLLSAVAHSCRAQRRLVPVWQRVRPEDWILPTSHDRVSSTCTQASAASSASSESRRMRQLCALLSRGGAGPPECWLAHLARGEPRPASGAGTGLREDGAARTTCWMLVLCTTRHAVWIDFLEVLVASG